jgi:hypothetical protein
MITPGTIVATSGVYELTAHEFILADFYGCVTVCRCDHRVMCSFDQDECDALIELFNEPAWGNC